MSKSSHAPNEEIDTSASNSVANDGESQPAARYRAVLDHLNNTPKFTTEWFRLKEEEVQLRSHPDCACLVDNSQVDDLQLREGNNEKISASSASDESATNTSEDRPSRGRFTFTSSSSQLEAKSGGGEREDTNLELIDDDPPLPFCAGSNANESDPPNSNKGKEGSLITSRSMSPTAHDPPNHDFKTVLKQTRINVGIVGEAAILMDQESHELLPVPVSWHNHSCEGGHRAKMVEGTVTIPSANDEGPSPLSFLSADDAAEKVCKVDTATRAKSEQSASNYTNHCQESLNGGDVQDSSAMSREVDVNQTLHFSSPDSLRDPSLPRLIANEHSQPAQNESVPDVEDREDGISIPEAIRVEANALVELPDVRVAEVVEPDHSTFPVRKRYACAAALCVAGIVTVIGILLRPPPSQQSHSIRKEIENNVLQRNAVFHDMEATDHRLLALQWITYKDEMKLVQSDPNLSQRYVLALLAYAFSIDSLWLSDESECEWFGVKCDTNGQVIELELRFSNLFGTIPPEISRLQYLQLLWLAGNSLHGTLPSEFGNLRKLSSFDLQRNSFTGALPSEIGTMNNLSELDLGGNEFSGEPPSELGLLSSLTFLNMFLNQFTGNLPSELGNLTSLTALDVRFNSFKGTLPTQLAGLLVLSYLGLERNEFTGTLPTWIGGMEDLTTLLISSNQFTGTLPSELGALTSLTSLHLSCNYFSGTFPTQIGEWKNLSQLLVNNNQFTGTFPLEVTSNSKLMQFCLDNNNFTGSVPQEVENDWSCTGPYSC
eukprot:CCRYP_019146-RA/>CCRYP_019146-RA protein AED:0.01 eAED:0.01 QI:283/1/1/1/1/1/2/346/772